MRAAHLIALQLMRQRAILKPHRVSARQKMGASQKLTDCVREGVAYRAPKLSVGVTIRRPNL